MAEKNRIAELDKAISSTKAELTAIQQEKEAAADDPERLVLAEKRERRISGTLAALERTRAAAAYKPPESTDCTELLLALQDYMDAKVEKEEKATAAIEAAKREAQEIEMALQKAAEDCDPDKTVELAEKKTELQSKIKYLAEMRERVQALPTFPEGAFAKAWSGICEKAMPDWKKAVLQVETLAEAYKAACAGLLAMHDTLKSARDEIGRMAEAEGYTPPVFAPVFTVGMDSTKLTVSKGDYIRLAGIEHPITGRAL